MSCGFTESPEQLDINWIEVNPEEQGQGVATRFANAAKAYCDQNGQQLILSAVTHTGMGFVNSLPYMNYEKPQQGDLPRFLSRESAGPTHQCAQCGQPLLDNGWTGFTPVTDGAYQLGDDQRFSAARICPTCGGPLQGEHGTFCPQCQWSEHDVNIDSDPLSSPPDPTLEFHRGIQAHTIPEDRWGGAWFAAIEASP